MAKNANAPRKEFGFNAISLNESKPSITGQFIGIVNRSRPKYDNPAEIEEIKVAIIESAIDGRCGLRVNRILEDKLGEVSKDQMVTIEYIGKMMTRRGEANNYRVFDAS